MSHARCISRGRAGARSGRRFNARPDFYMAMDHYENDERQATLSVMLLAIMSVVITGLIVMAVLSTRACTV